MIGTTPIRIRTSLGISPMPSQMMNSGMNASGGSGLSTSIDGVDRVPDDPAGGHAAPRATPITVPTAKPIRIRRRLVSASNHRGLP